MNLVMFDIDGTLTKTNEVDHLCFVQALSEGLQIGAADTDWTEYKNVTDQGCLEEFILRNTGRPATQEESASIRERHIELLAQYAETKPHLFAPVPGAMEMLSDLDREPEAAVCLATGAWSESAHIKLRTAGFPANSIPMATSSDAMSREEIMMLAESKAAEVVGPPGFRTRTYVGDAPWDVQAAHKLGYGFIGIAEGARADALKTAGARWVLSDFTKRNCFVELLQAIWNA